VQEEEYEQLLLDLGDPAKFFLQEALALALALAASCSGRPDKQLTSVRLCSSSRMHPIYGIYHYSGNTYLGRPTLVIFKAPGGVMGVNCRKGSAFLTLPVSPKPSLNPSEVTGNPPGHLLPPPGLGWS